MKFKITTFKNLPLKITTLALFNKTVKIFRTMEPSEYSRPSMDWMRLTLRAEGRLLYSICGFKY